jgi:hypothetical protein
MRIQKGQDILHNLFKPSCINCKFLNKVTDNKAHPKEQLFKSTCKKFMVSSTQNIHYEKSFSIDYTEKHPYALMARLDITMCGLNGTYFINK